MATIAFVGLGVMGARMARNLIRAGHALTGFDPDAAALAAFAAQGGRPAGDPLAAAREAEFVFTMLPDDARVAQVYLGEGGLIAGLSSRPLLVDCSTVGPDTSRALAAAAAARGLTMLDAPVSGGPHGAEAATLAFMVGGPAQGVAAVTPILKAMGRAILHVGESGAGSVAKLCNNMVAAVVMASTAEALALGAAQGLDPARLSEVMAASSGGSFVVSRWNPWPGVTPEAPASRGYRDGFQIALMLKDLGLAVESARRLGAPTPFGALAQSLYAMKAREGADAARRDFSSIQEMFVRA
jgi:3-hydroxyisobutyrate dehydrogenase